jgi:polyisoprenoid-binding protein YceI
MTSLVSKLKEILMKRIAFALVGLVALVGFAAAARGADEHRVDPVHSSVVFRVTHMGIGAVYGRFNDFGGTVALDEGDPAKSAVNFEIQVAGVDTHQEKRDAHLKSPDFFNAKQYPTITFKSTAVKKSEKPNTLDVTGDLTMHGTTKSITVPVEIIGKGQFMGARVGIESIFTVKMSEFGFKGNPGVGDEVKLLVALEAAKL